MNSVLVDIFDEFIAHSGVKRRSGRHPYGSGEIPYQHEPWFTWGQNGWLNKYRELEDKGMSKTEIAKELGLSTTECRLKYKNAVNDERAKQIAANESLIKAGYENRSERARMMGMNESTLRSLEERGSKERTEKARTTAKFLKEQVDKKGPIDISVGVERRLGISKDKLNQAVKILTTEEGYTVYRGRMPQATNKGKFTTQTVLCPPGTAKNAPYQYDNIHMIDIPDATPIDDYKSYDNGKSFKKSFRYPASMDSKRIYIRYAEDGGTEKDGTIEIRPGVPDLSLGNSNYAQVRILVDNDKYMKGMAFYMDRKTQQDIPEGYDVVYNSNKSKDQTDKVFKKITNDPNNPFGSLIKETGGQSEYTDPKTGEKKLSLINKRSDEGDWDEWADRLPSQFLSKQPASLVKQQLYLTISDKEDELNDILSLENPTVKRNLLIDFSQEADKTAEHLYAGALPRQKYKVILPVNSLKDNECYCPTLKDGTTVALIRFPHGGTFEIPILKVRNKNQEGIDIMGNAPLDSIGINHNVAARLSGADFDGDTVLIIPDADKHHIKSTPKLKELEGLDLDKKYQKYEGMDIMTEPFKQLQMGIVSNLITDMTIKGASSEELARAVEHSMVVIDAVKHELDYKTSYKVNGIDKLKKEYQGHYDLNGEWREAGASTILSRAKSEWDVEPTQGEPSIDIETGKLVWKPKMKTVIDEKGNKTEVIDNYYIDKNGVRHPRIKKTTQMQAVDDAYKLVSDTENPIELAYAEFANRMKTLANEARKASLNTGKLEYNSDAALIYSDAVKSLNDKVRVAEWNAPLERAAQRKANAVANEKEKLYSDLTEKEKGKIRQQALQQARIEYGAQRHPIDITDHEWEAIQKGAISDNKLRTILKYADSDKVKQLAMPRNKVGLSSAKQNRIRAMKAAGYTIAEIADRMDVSTSTISKYLSEVKNE